MPLDDRPPEAPDSATPSDVASGARRVGVRTRAILAAGLAGAGLLALGLWSWRDARAVEQRERDVARALAAATTHAAVGRADLAARELESALRHAPEAPAVLGALATLLHREGATLGVTPDSAWQVLTRAAAVDSTTTALALPLLTTAARRGDEVAVDSLLPDAAAVDSVGARHALAIATLDPALVASTTSDAAADSVASDSAIARQRLLSALLHLPQGIRVAAEPLARLFRASESWATEVVALHAALGGITRAPELRALAGRVLLPAPGESAAPSGTGQAGAQGIAPPRRRLLAGLILARLSDAEDQDHAERLAETLLRWDGAPAHQAEARRYGHILTAELRLAAGDPAGALDSLGTPNRYRTRAVDLLDWPTAHERWIRARAHAALGHAAEAMTWLHGFPDPSGSDLAHVAGAIALRAELATRLGDREQARRDTAVLATPRR